MSYRALDDKTVLDYVRGNRQLQLVFSDMDALTAQEVGDGNLNQVFIIRSSANPNEATVLKQALPYLRVAGDSWPLTRERTRYEAQALMLYNQLVPGLAPQVHCYDPEMSIVSMEYLGTHQTMRRPMVERQRFPRFTDHISTFLATVLFKTSDLYLTGVEKKKIQSDFINPHLNKIQEDFVFTNPYMTSPDNQWNPEITPDVEAVRRNTPLKWAIAELKEKYMTQAQALIHSDLHTGSIMVTTQDTRVIDPEFAYVGPMGYDVGALMSNLMMNYATHFAHTPDPGERQAYQAYLMLTMREIWRQFAAKFEALWVEHNSGELVPNAYWDYEGGEAAFREYRRAYLLRLLRDTAGLGACESLRRTMGIVSVWDISSIQDAKLRAVAERFIIRVSTRWILERSSFNGIEDMLGVVQEETRATQV